MATLPFCCRRRRISADQNAVTRRLFFGGRACGRQQLYGNAQALPLNMFYIAATGGSNYKNIIFCDAALP
jgi:hypothetical protein